MTVENRTANAAAELAMVRRFLQAADALAAQNLADRATSQAYYALFHAVRALLLTEGLEPRTHKGAQHLLNIHFVRPGEVEHRHLATLSDLQREREEADYIASYPNDPAQYAALRGRVDEAITALCELLARRGVQEPSQE